MEEKELKTSPKQRVFIIVIAVIMIGSIIASYAAIIINGNKSSNATGENKIDEAKIAQYEEAYSNVQAELTKVAQDDYNTFIQYKGEIKAYNEISANENGVQAQDLLKGSGKKLAQDDTDYLAYYVGWCADESVFDSTFDDAKNPTGFSKVLNPSAGMIEGWKLGIEGMHLGGVREITIPGDLAYGDSMEICGGKNKPLKFLVMAVANEDPLKGIAKEYDDAYMRLQYANYGIDYDEVMKSQD